MALLDMKHKKEMHDKREKELKKLAEEALAHDDWRFRHHKEYVAILKGENGKLANGEDLYMSTDLWLCVKEQIYAEFGDKTFLCRKSTESRISINRKSKRTCSNIYGDGRLGRIFD